MANRDLLVLGAIAVVVAALARKQDAQPISGPMLIPVDFVPPLTGGTGVSPVGPMGTVLAPLLGGQVSLTGSGMPSLVPHPIANPTNPAVVSQVTPLQQSLSPLPEGAVVQDGSSPTGFSIIVQGAPQPFSLAQADPLQTLAPASSLAPAEPGIMLPGPPGVNVSPTPPTPEPSPAGPIALDMASGVMASLTPATTLADVVDLSVSIPPADASPQAFGVGASAFAFDPFWADFPFGASVSLSERVRQRQDDEVGGGDSGGDAGGDGGGDAGGGGEDSGGGEAAQSQNPFVSSVSVWVGRRSGESFVPVPDDSSVRPNELISLNAQGAIGGREVEFSVRNADGNLVFHSVLTASLAGNVSTNLSAPLTPGTYGVTVETGHLAVPFLGAVGSDTATASFVVSAGAPAAPLQPRTGLGAFLPNLGDIKDLGGMALVGLALVAAIVVGPKLIGRKE